MTARIRGKRQNIVSAERVAQAMQLRKAGATYLEVAKALGYASPSSAYRAVKAGLAATLLEPAEELRLMQHLRIEALTMAHWQKAIKGDAPSTLSIVRLMVQQAKLFGLYTPVVNRSELEITLTRMSELAAAHFDVDPAEVIAAAEAILKEAGG